MDRDNTVKADYIRKNQDRLIMSLGYFDMPDLVDFKPENSVFIKSASEAHNEEEEIDLDRLKNWLGHFKVDYHHFHASGHASGIEIAEMVNSVKPKVLIPIHTKKPEEFSKVTDVRVEMAKI